MTQNKEVAMQACDFCDREAVCSGTDYCLEPFYLCDPCSSAFCAGIDSPEYVVIPIADLDEEYLRAIAEDNDGLPN